MSDRISSFEPKIETRFVGANRVTYETHAAAQQSLMVSALALKLPDLDTDDTDVIVNARHVADYLVTSLSNRPALRMVMAEILEAFRNG